MSKIIGIAFKDKEGREFIIPSANIALVKKDDEYAVWLLGMATETIRVTKEVYDDIVELI